MMPEIDKDRKKGIILNRKVNETEQTTVSLKCSQCQLEYLIYR